MNRSSTLAASLMAACTMLLLSASFSDAAQMRQPQAPQTPVTTPDPGDNNSKPAVDFDADIWTQLAAKDPYVGKLECKMWTNPSIGYPLIWMTNHSGKTIPAGSILTWTLPGGQTFTITLKIAIEPGSFIGVNPSPQMLAMGDDFWCKVKVDWSPARVL